MCITMVESLIDMRWLRFVLTVMNEFTIIRLIVNLVENSSGLILAIRVKAVGPSGNIKNPLRSLDIAHIAEKGFQRHVLTEVACRRVL